MSKILSNIKKGCLLNGYFRLIDEEELKSYIDPSIYELEEYSPFAISVFGEILAFEDHDYITLIDFPKDSCNVIAPVETFLELINDEEFVSDWFMLDLYKEVKDKYGEINENQIYGFAPLLFLGGKIKVKNLDICDWRVHLHLIHSFINK